LVVAGVLVAAGVAGWALARRLFVARAVT